MATPVLAISNAGKDPEFDFEPPNSTTTTTTTIIATTTTTSIPSTRSGRTRLLRTLKGSAIGTATSPAIGGSNAANKAGASSSGTTTTTANSTPSAVATPLSSSLNSSSPSSTSSSAATPSPNDSGAGGILGCHAHGGSITNRELRCHQCGRRPPCHHQLHSRRIQKIKHRSSASTSSPASIITTPTAASSSFVAAMPATNGDSMDTPVFSYWGSDPVPLPSRFARIKRDLVRGNEAAISASWTRLLQALRAETEHIENLGAHLIPSIQYADIQDSTQTQRFAEALKRYGVGVVRGVVPAEDAERAIKDTVQYVVDTDTVKPPPVQDPTCFDFFWTPAQVRMRAHPDVLTAQRFMMSLWETKSSDRLSTKCPVTYADRLRIHGATIGNPASQQPTPRHDGTNGISAPASADDWLNAIQSSTIIAQVDNGSLERWEPDGYTRAGTYSSIFCGQFEAYDPWAPGGRIATTTDLYNGYGACSIFRMFQGILALSTIEPGMVRLLPSPKLATAYFLLRPFFSPKTPPPEAREGPEWEAFLAPENWQLDKEPNTIIHGAVPGHAQRLTELWHPHLHLRRSLVTLPTLLRGDYILWHPDLPYHINSDTSLRSLNTQSDTDVSMLVYIPAAPLTQTNALYLARQRKAFLRGYPGPDFDSTGSGLGSEAQHSDRPGEAEIAKIGGPDGLRAMGLAPWEVAGTPVGEVDKKDRDDDIEMATGAQTPRGTPNAEDEVIRLGNIIVHPDQCMMGFPGHARKGS